MLVSPSHASIILILRNIEATFVDVWIPSNAWALKGGKSGDNAKIRSYHGGGAKGKKVGVRVLVVI